MKIKIVTLSGDEIRKRGISDWPIWEKEVSNFDWHYDSEEECLLLEGHVQVTMPDGEMVEFREGDFVSFPKGLSCQWNVLKPVKKHYNFK